jgi:arylformamidase
MRASPKPFVTAGAHYVILDFTNVDDAGGSLFPMIEQVRRAVGWVYKNAKSFGGDPNRLYLTSHLLRLPPRRLRGDARLAQGQLPVDILKGATLSSGMYDLKPVRLSKRSKYVKFTDEMEEALSAQRHLDRLNLPLILAYGTYETPEFQRQTRDFYAAVKAAGKPVELLVGEGYNHFEMLETLANPTACSAALRWRRWD